MPAYRFCRPDDIPKLVRAVNECYNVHFPDAEPLTVERFRAEMKELGVWPSNSLAVMAGEEPIAVLIGTKREHEVLVLRLGVRPDYRRQGHGGHVLTSLSQKLAVLGPPRLVAEVPLDLPGVADFFAAVGYESEAVYVDWVRPPGAAEPVPDELVIPISVAEVADEAWFEIGRHVAWERSRETVVNSADALEGLAIATPERLEACLFFRSERGRVDVVAMGVRDPDRQELFSSLLLRALAGRDTSSIRLPKLSDGEVPETVLESSGFRPGRRFARYAACATPA